MVEDVVLDVLMKHEVMKAEEAAMAGTRAIENEIMGELARLGGKLVNDEDIEWKGRQIVLPQNSTIRQNIRFLEKKEAELEKETTFTKTFNYRPWDGANAMWNVFRRVFGSVSHKDSMVKTMFGKMAAPPEMITIPTGVGTEVQVPWGRFELPQFENTTFEADTQNHKDKGPLFYLIATGPKKYKYQIEGIFRLISEELEQDSMYRGRAFDGQIKPEFVDLGSVDPRRVVYSKEVLTQLNANVWAQLEHTAEFLKMGIPLKRAVLIHGPFGTGKTLACMLTAQKAVANGWTFIQARPGRDDLATVLQTAKLYEPAVVFYEDIDVIASPDDANSVSKLLDDFDGISAKGTRILMVLTTNYPERIHKGMARPGRLDAMIEINELDQDGVESLVRVRIEDMLAPEIDWAAVFESAESYKPAFVTEGADRTVRYILARGGAVGDQRVTTEDLVGSMQGLRPQFDMMTGAKDSVEPDTFAELIKGHVSDVLQSHQVGERNGDLKIVPLNA